MDGKRSTTKKFHILKRNGIISNYFNEGRVKEYWNFKFANDEYKNGREIGWTNILAHDITDWDAKWIEKYNLIEDKTTKNEDIWTRRRLNDILSSDNILYRMEKIDRDYIIDVYEKIAFSANSNFSEYDNLYNKKCIKKIGDPISVKSYIDYKHNIPLENDHYKQLISHLKKFKKYIKKVNFMYVLEIENILTSEPIQMKTIILNNTKILSILFQVSPKKIIVIPFIQSIIDNYNVILDNDKTKYIVRTAFFSIIDIYAIHEENDKEKCNDIIWNNTKTPAFLYLKSGDEISSFYKEIIDSVNSTPPSITFVQTKMPENGLEAVMSIYAVLQDYMLLSEGKENEILPHNKSVHLGESVGYVINENGRECDAYKYILNKFDFNGEIIIFIKRLMKNNFNFSFYKEKDGKWTDENGSTLIITGDFVKK